jgi:hypothetical protein
MHELNRRELLITKRVDAHLAALHNGRAIRLRCGARHHR